MRSRQALVVFVQREFSNPFTTAHINKEAEREFNACVNFVRWKRHYGKQCMTVCLCVGEHKHRFRIWQATHIHNLLTVTHIHSNVKSKWAMFAVVSCVMLSKQTIRMEQMKKRERESEFESSFQESKTTIRLVNQTFGVNELLLLLLVVPLVIYKNIYRGSFDCVGAKINAPQKANRFRFISMVTKHSFPLILHGLWRLVQLFFSAALKKTKHFFDISEKTRRNKKHRRCLWKTTRRISTEIHPTAFFPQPNQLN